MATLTDNQARQFLKHFYDVVEDCRCGNHTKAKKVITQFKKNLKRPTSLPWVDLYTAAYENGTDNNEEAVFLCDKIAATKPTEPHFVRELINMYRTLGCDEKCLPFFKGLVASRPKDADLLIQFITLCIICADFKTAQESAMTLVRNQPDRDTAKLLCGVCCYFRGCAENQPSFFKFAKLFLMKIKCDNWDTIYILFQSHLRSGDAQAALDLIRKDTTKEALGYDKLGLARLEIEALKALGKNEEVGAVAENVLRTVDSDSIDEWRLVVEHNAKAAEIIEELDDGIKRGPRIARIDLAKKQGKDIVPLIIDYVNKKPNAAFLFGDLRKYFTEDVKARLVDVNDQALHALATGEFSGEVSDSRAAVIKAETILAKYNGDEAVLREAIKVIEPFADSTEGMMLLVRLSSMMGATEYLRSTMKKLKLEAILYLSTGNAYFNGLIKYLDLDVLSEIAKNTDTFTFNSLANYQYYYGRGVEGKHFLPLQQTTEIRQQIRKHLITYLAKTVRVWCKALEDPKGEVHMAPDHFKSSSEIDGLVNITDETPLPVFCDGVKDVLYPEAITITKAVSAITRAVIAKTEEERNAAIDDIPDGEYKAFGEAVKSNFEKIETDNLFVLASIAMVANKLGKKVESLTGKIDSYAEARIKEIEALPELMKDSVEQQKKNLTATIEQIKKIFV